MEKISLKNVDVKPKKTEYIEPRYDKDGRLKAVVFRKADASKEIIDYIGRKHPNFHYYEKAFGKKRKKRRKNV